MQTSLATVTTLIIGYYIVWRGFNDLQWLQKCLAHSYITTIFFLLHKNYISEIRSITVMV
jgi:hypothetical protein